jgi:peptidoglycan/LPS O-acetylase OafA/YrhL
MSTLDKTVREGLIAGFIGATSIAIWFLIVDTVANRPFYTPTVLGIGLLSVFGPRGDEGPVAQVIAYTIFHYAVFFGIGILVSYIVHRAEKDDTVLAVALILFVALEVGFYGLVAVLSESRQLGSFAWYQVLAGNLIAAATMGTYIWRTHPELRRELEHALVGDE